MTSDKYEWQVLPYNNLFTSIQAARNFLEEKFGLGLRTRPKFYNECEWHGDGEIVMLPNGTEVAEIICLLNGNFCNPDEGKFCGYQAEVYHFHMCEDGEKLPCLSRSCAPKSGNEVWYDQAQAKANEELFRG